MYRCWLAVLLFYCPLIAASQAGQSFSIRGKVMDSVSLKAIPYATVLLTDEKQVSVASGYTGETGAFILAFTQAGTFQLTISSVGYADKTISVTIAAGIAAISLDSLYLSPASGMLSGVTVTANKRIIEQRPGMLVYNAEVDVTNKGGTAADVLRKAPVLNVDAQGNVSMRGNSNLKILINGKYSGQIARSPADALNMMPAEIIKSVEVITMPSAKYDAEGAAGVINIITKKGRKDINGALELSASNLEQMFNPRIAINKDKWSFSFHGHIHRYRTKEAAITERVQFENGATLYTLDQRMEKDNGAPHGSADIALVYTPDSLTEISFGSNAWLGNWPDDKTIETAIRSSSGTILEQYSQSIDAAEKYLGSDINIGYSRKFKQPGREITLLGQFSPSKNRSPYQFYQRAKSSGDIIYREKNDNYTNNHEWTVQADYIHPVGKKNIYTLEGGGKIILRNVNNDYTISFSDGDPILQPDPTRSDVFKYRQDVYAGYAMLKANLKNNWYAEAGLRVEHTVLNGKFTAAAGSFENAFTNLVPTATISKKISEDQTLTVSYTQRLTRPYIWDLNPNADASDPKNIITGNPSLQPEITKQAELTYGLNKGSRFFLNTALFWKQTDNSIIDFTQVEANGVSVTSKQNLAGNKMFGVNFSSSITLSPVWSVNGNININYLDYSSSALQVFSTGWAADVDINTTIRLPRRYSLQVFGEYDSRKPTLQGYDSYQYFYSMAVKKEISDKNLVLTLSLVNPFSKYIPQHMVMRSTDFNSSIRRQYFNRAVKFTINWEFGNMFNQRDRKKISNDDIKGAPKG